MGVLAVRVYKMTLLGLYFVQFFLLVAWIISLDINLSDLTSGTHWARKSSFPGLELLPPRTNKTQMTFPITLVQYFCHVYKNVCRLQKCYQSSTLCRHVESLGKLLGHWLKILLLNSNYIFSLKVFWNWKFTSRTRAGLEVGYVKLHCFCPFQIKHTFGQVPRHCVDLVILGIHRWAELFWNIYDCT